MGKGKGFSNPTGKRHPCGASYILPVDPIAPAHHVLGIPEHRQPPDKMDSSPNKANGGGFVRFVVLHQKACQVNKKTESQPCFECGCWVERSMDITDVFFCCLFLWSISWYINLLSWINWVIHQHPSTTASWATRPCKNLDPCEASDRF